MRSSDVHSPQTILQALDLMATGVIPAEVSRQLNVPESTLRQWRGQKGLHDQCLRMDRLRALDEQLEERNIDPRDVVIKGARVSTREWDVTAKVKDVDPKTGKITGQHLETKKNHGKGIEISFSPKFAEGPKWPVIVPSPSITLPKSTFSRPKRAKWKMAVICSDEQIFYWQEQHTEIWSAGHDERAMDVVLQAIEDLQPDRIVDGGDLLDNPEQSGKFRKYPEFQKSTQRAVNRGGLWVAQLRQAAPYAKIDEIEGNHDARMRYYLIDNAAAAHGITRSYDQRKPLFRDQPANSIPYLLRFDEHNIDYSAAFPAGDVWLNPGVVFAHANGKIDTEERATLFHGHDHKVHETWRTVHHQGKPLFRGVVGVGTLARIDEVVGDDGRAMPTHIPAASVRQNWQQGFAIVHYLPNGGPSDLSVQLVRIQDGRAVVNLGGEAREYVARPRTVDGYLVRPGKSKVA